jgi:transposase
MDQASWVAAHVAAFEFFQGCPRRIVLDTTGAPKQCGEHHFAAA